jgi:hypothetical protein
VRERRLERSQGWIVHYGRQCDLGYKILQIWMKDGNANGMGKEETTERSKRTQVTALLVINKSPAGQCDSSGFLRARRDVGHRSAVPRTGDCGMGMGCSIW